MQPGINLTRQSLLVFRCVDVVRTKCWIPQHNNMNCSNISESTEQQSCQSYIRAVHLLDVFFLFCFFWTRQNHFAAYFLWYKLCIAHTLSLSCPRSNCESTHGRLVPPAGGALNLNRWACTSYGQSLLPSAKAAVKLHCTATFHLSVADCDPSWLIIEPLLWPETILTWIPCQADSIYGVNISACSHLILSESEPACWVVTQITPVKVMTGASWHAWRVWYSPNSFTSEQQSFPSSPLPPQSHSVHHIQPPPLFFFFL